MSKNNPPTKHRHVHSSSTSSYCALFGGSSSMCSSLMKRSKDRCVGVLTLPASGWKLCGALLKLVPLGKNIPGLLSNQAEGSSGVYLMGVV